MAHVYTAAAIEDERRNWTTYSQRQAQSAPADMIVENQDLPTKVYTLALNRVAEYGPT